MRDGIPSPLTPETYRRKPIKAPNGNKSLMKIGVGILLLTEGPGCSKAECFPTMKLALRVQRTRRGDRHTLRFDLWAEIAVSSRSPGLCIRVEQSFSAHQSPKSAVPGCPRSLCTVTWCSHGPSIDVN